MKLNILIEIKSRERNSLEIIQIIEFDTTHLIYKYERYTREFVFIYLF